MNISVVRPLVDKLYELDDVSISKSEAFGPRSYLSHYLLSLAALGAASCSCFESEKKFFGIMARL